jgi:hypothetical protein
MGDGAGQVRDVIAALAGQAGAPFWHRAQLALFVFFDPNSQAVFR